jgi:flagellar capping protein FliD
MAEQELKINVNGEMIPVHDIKKLVEASTKKDQEAINKLSEDLVMIDKDRVAVKSFLNTLNTLKDLTSSFVSSGLNHDKAIFNQKFVMPMNSSFEESLKYLSLETKSDVSIPDHKVSIEVKNLATAARWQSKTLPKNKALVQKATENNPNFFRAGFLDLLIKNQAKISQQVFTNPNTLIVGNNPGQFTTGAFFINDIKIDLTLTDTLTSLINKINLAKGETGVIADLLVSQGNYQLLLKNEKICGEEIMIDDLDGLFYNLSSDSSGNYFTDYKEYKTIELQEKDSLDDILHKINKEAPYTNLYAKVMEPNRGQKKLILEGKNPGVINTFEIKDNGTIINGSNSGSVLNGLFQLDGSFNPLLEEASNSLIKFDDFDIYKSSNDFVLNDSLIFNLKSPTASKISFQIGMNIDLVAKTVQSFVETYNSLRETFSKENSGDNKKNILQKDWVLGDFFRNLESRLYLLKDTNDVLSSFPELDIGLSVGKKTVEIEEADGKKVTKTLENMLFLDLDKFVKTCLAEPAKIQNFFDLSFTSSSSNFTQPLLTKAIGINYQSLDNALLQLELSVDPDKAKVYSYSSKVISDITKPFDPSLPNSFKSGTFWLNGEAITLSNTMTPEKIVEAINKVSNNSRISASLSNNQINFIQYQGSFSSLDDATQYQKMHLYDPGQVLASLFSTDVQTSAIGSSLNTSTSTLVAGGKLSINGLEITLSNNTINSLINDINAIKDKTGVIAKSIMQSDGQYSILFESSKLQQIVLVNLGAITGITLPTDSRNSFFFNTGEVVTGKLFVNGQAEDKLFAYRISGNERNSGATITVINYRNSTNRIDNVELHFLGSYKDSCNITIKQGLASFIKEKIEKINPDQFSVNGLYNSLNNELDTNQQKLKDTISHKKKLLEDIQHKMTVKLSKAVNNHDRLKAMEEMLSAMTNNK